MTQQLVGTCFRPELSRVITLLDRKIKTSTMGRRSKVYSMLETLKRITDYPATQYEKTHHNGSFRPLTRWGSLR